MNVSDFIIFNLIKSVSRNSGLHAHSQVKVRLVEEAHIERAMIYNTGLVESLPCLLRGSCCKDT